MKNLSVDEIASRAQKIRARYHELELEHHGSHWSVSEDALAFLSDAGLIGRLTMAQQNRWPKGNEAALELEHKIGECVWWLATLADRMDLDINEVIEKFLAKTETHLKI